MKQVKFLLSVLTEFGNFQSKFHINTGESMNNSSIDFSLIASNENTADDAVTKMYIATENNPSMRRMMYLTAPRLLESRFAKKKVLSALNCYAQFDVYSDVKFIRRSAQALIYRYKMSLDHPKFMSEMKSVGMAGFTTGDLLYVAHKCTKKNSLEWQCTVFGRNIGPLSDSQHRTIEEIIAQTGMGAGIPVCSEFLSYKQLMEIESQFLPAKNAA